MELIELTEKQLAFKILCEPKTRTEWLKSGVACITYQINSTENAWNCKNWKEIIGEIVGYQYPYPTVWQNVKFRSCMERRKEIMFNKGYHNFGGSLRGLSNWILLQVNLQNNSVLNIIRNDYVPYLSPDEVLHGDGILSDELLYLDER